MAYHFKHIRPHLPASVFRKCRINQWIFNFLHFFYFLTFQNSSPVSAYHAQNLSQQEIKISASPFRQENNSALKTLKVHHGHIGNPFHSQIHLTVLLQD